MSGLERDLGEVYRLYAEDIYRYVYSLCGNRAVAEDILQETFLRAVKGFGDFRGECSVRTWLIGIARNLYRNHAKRMDNRNLPIDEAILGSAESVEERILEQAQSEQLHRLLHGLEEPYREVFTLRVFAELKFDLIGSLFGKSANWARVTFYRAKEKLITMMKEEDV